jgi:hypothetical protein
MAINIAEFRRPGIFIKEIDQSIRQTPVQDTIVNLVPGFSKKGPVNRPVLISSPQELQDVFGAIDRNLESKGSFFHRTIQNILSQSPVWALNLLKTDDELDLLPWKSVSLSSSIVNAPLLKDPYSRFFNRNEFWERDTESFLNIAKSKSNIVDKVLHVTNMSDKKITVYIFKSSLKGFDITAETWYEGRDKVPTWMYATDLISDYLVKVLVVAGDWSDTATLSVDPRWSKYFSISGLRKNTYRNFLTDTAVTLLKEYDLSLIPYFRDKNGADLFIETVINRDTDTTGLFVSYDIDALETEAPNGLVDLIGHTLAHKSVEKIEFVSYKETIIESLSFKEVPLNNPGNVFGSLLDYETKWVNDIIPTWNVTASDNTNKVSVIELANIPSIVFNSRSVALVALQKVNIPDATANKIRKDTIYVDALGQISVVQGTEVSNLTSWSNVPLRAVPTFLYPIAIVEVGTSGSSGFAGVANASAVTSLPNLVWTTGTVGDLLIEQTGQVLSQGQYELTVTFNSTKSTDADVNYKKFRLLSLFQTLQSKTKIGETIISGTIPTSATPLVVLNTKVISAEFTTSGSENKAVKFTTPNSFKISKGIVTGSELAVYYQNVEYSLGKYGLRTNAATIPVNNPTGDPTIVGDYGIVSVDSIFYRAFIDGSISTGDFFYPNVIPNGEAIPALEFFIDSLGQSTIKMYTNTDLLPGISGNPELNSQGDMIFLKGADLNEDIFTILSSSKIPGSFSKGGASYGFETTFVVNEAVATQNLYNTNVTIHDANPDNIVYLKMYTINGDLFVDFVNSSDIATAGAQDIVTNDNAIISIFSDRNNFRQTLEIESVLEQNKFLIKADRYGELKIGDYVDAYIDPTFQGVAKGFTRIVGKQVYPSDPSLSQITTDAAVKYLDFGGDKQTIRYSIIDEYVNNYQAIILDGFRIRPDSMPNGTEVRQSAILDILAPGTPIFNGLKNRNKISWRYLIDSFGLGLTSNSKQQLVDICGARLNALGLLNMPSAKAFKNSTSPTFVNPDGTLNYTFVRLGGNPQSNPAFTFTFGQGSGQSNVAYFFPYATILDNGRTLLVPPSMFVANTFMRKHNTRRSDVYPWTIAAGLTNGLVTGFGNVEVDIDDTGIEELNNMGANPLIYKINRGFNIETNNTAQAVPQTALSNIHVREVLIELENELYQMLLTYQWRFNTPEVRAEIKQRADAICSRFVSQNGLFDFFNQIDESNNTNELIDAGIGVLDTFVEPVQGLGVIVNQITILKTGAIESGGFRTQA